MSHERLTRNTICAWLQFHMKKIGLARFWVVNQSGTYVAKLGRMTRPSSYSIKGVPDIIGYYSSGRFFAIEVKRDKQMDLARRKTLPAGRLSAEQKQFIDHANAHGCDCFVARNIEDLEQHFKVG